MQMSNRTFLIHFIGCIAFLSLPILFSPDNDQLLNLIHIPPFQRAFVNTVLLLIFFYFNYYFLIPKLYDTKKYATFFAIVLICFVVVVLVPELTMLGHRMPRPPREFGDSPPPGRHFLLALNHNFFQFAGVLIFSLMLHGRERLKKIETEKANAELSYLKAQINPHFLFNTLNSIYSLAILKSDKTADALVKLSDMMRYVLNDGNTNFVLLEKELNYIANYIELQKMRLASNIKLTYTCVGQPGDKKIAPLILIPFIENAFKHGVNTEENSDIDIQIKITDTTAHLLVKNNCVQTNNNTLNKSGLGIDNTKQRLQLLYPDSHLLKIDKLDNSFIVELNLNIHD
jgi:hypothetical protein